MFSFPEWMNEWLCQWHERECNKFCVEIIKRNHMGVVAWCMASKVFIRDMDSNLHLLMFTHLCSQTTRVSNSLCEQPGLTGTGGHAFRGLVGWVAARQIPLNYQKKSHKRYLF